MKNVGSISASQTLAPFSQPPLTLTGRAGSTLIPELSTLRDSNSVGLELGWGRRSRMYKFALLTASLEVLWLLLCGLQFESR